MTAILTAGRSLAASIEALGDRTLIGLILRLAFAAVLMRYYWNSAATKISDGASGLLSVQDNAYYQILPTVVEAAGSDVEAIAFLPWGLIVHAGTYAEMLLPLLIVLGLFTRLAALGMISFVIVQSLTDVLGHGADAATIGALFDIYSDSLILDQRSLWVALLAILVFKGAGSLSLDRLVFGRSTPVMPR